MSHLPLHVVFTGGGTGGHLFPGMAVAEQLAARQPSARITFAGSGKEFERRHAVAAGFEYLALGCRPLPHSAREAFSFLIDNLGGYLAACRFLREEQVAAVVGLGGYASVPMARAAGKCGVPLVLLEQNAVPGKATRWLARSASLICIAFEESRARLRCRCPVYRTGTPIRLASPGAMLHCVGGDDASTGIPDNARGDCSQGSSTFRVVGDRTSPRRRQLLVLGGSNGARTLNEHVPLALGKIRQELDGWQVVHQSGEAGFEAAWQSYQKAGLRAKVVPFFAEMPRVLAATGLAVCRAGGTTLAELAAARVPAILLPYPHAADDHQRRNADVFSAAGAAVTLDQRELSGRLEHHLAREIARLLGRPELREQMSLAMRRLASPLAARDVAVLVESAAAGHLGRDEIPAAA